MIKVPKTAVRVSNEQKHIVNN